MPHNYSKPKTYPNPSFLAPSAIPPVLPPSVEEAYRRKCIQLRSRTQTVSDANDAARIRLLRMRRGIEKMRLERAFLLEQVARRVKPNDDSSDGSPSPPPTVGNCPNLLFISHISYLRLAARERRGGVVYMRLKHLLTLPPAEAEATSS